MTVEKTGPPHRKFGSLGFAAILVIMAMGAVFAYMWIHKENLQKNERNASATLKTLASAEASFRMNDTDGNGVKDYWTGDICGLWRYDRLISRELAEADSSPLEPLVDKPVPYHGYFFKTLQRDLQNKITYNSDTDDSGRKVHNSSRFGFCAYPVEYGSTGNTIFIINENNTIFKVENGGKPIEDWPIDLDLIGENRWGRGGD